MTGTRPSLADRLRGAIWGQFVGDAACLGVHWTYDLREIARVWPDGIRGFEEPESGVWPHSSEATNVPAHKHPKAHHHAGKRAGDQTHYGHAGLVLLESLVDRGRFDELDFGRRFVETFGAADYAGYADQAMKGMLAKYRVFRAEHPDGRFDFQHGADDFEPAGIARLAGAVVAHRDDPELLEVVERATRVEQNNMRAVAYGRAHALVLRSIFRGASLDTAVAEVESAFPAGAEASGERRDEARRDRLRASTEQVTETYGAVCRVDFSFPTGWPATAITPRPKVGPMCLHTVCSTEVGVPFPTAAEVRDEVRGALRAAREAASDDVVTATKTFGQGCRLDWSFPAALQCALHHAGDFRA
ncbi:MAG: ADP-ribosylglycohydrolase family protein, partial [Chloroflexi bacterium]|nr:ADP-ribosylglycohydrolase family protein [Chloroflexota bacterium]